MGVGWPKQTPEILDQLEAYIEDGYSNNLARQAVGIDEATFYRWLQAKPELKERFDKARARSCQKALQKIRDNDDWRAQAHWLALVKPDEFAQSALLKKLVEDYGLADEQDDKKPETPDEAETTA